MADEYIKREDMNNTLDEMCVVDGIYNALQAIPAADVVEIVRCKNCKHWYSPMNDDAHYCNLKHGLVGIVAEEDYCSYGERSEK